MFGAAGLLGLFGACVDGFEFIRVSGHVGKEYEDCRLKLDILGLRFYR